jgi:hypothetical protein
LFFQKLTVFEGSTTKYSRRKRLVETKFVEKNLPVRKKLREGRKLYESGNTRLIPADGKIV